LDCRGINGSCSIFDPPFSFWCKGGAHKTGFTPSGVQLDSSFGHVDDWVDPVAGGGEFFAWREGNV